MRLSKEICNLQRRKNKRKSNGVMLKMMMSRMKIDLNVLVRSWKIELWAIQIEFWLSQYIAVGWKRDTLIYASNQRNQTISLVIDVVSRYSTSVEDWKIMDCFLLFQEIRESPEKIQKPVKNLWSVGSLSWSTLKYACSSKEEVDGCKLIWKTIPWRYHKIQRTTVQRQIPII